MQSDTKTAKIPHRTKLAFAVPIIVLTLAVTQPYGVSMAVANPVSKPASATKAASGSFSPELIVGRWKWVKSTIAMRFANGSTVSNPVKPKPNSTLTFTRGRNTTKAVSGKFSGTDFEGNAMNGTWSFVGGGSDLALTFVVENPGSKPQTFTVLEKSIRLRRPAW